MTSHTLRVECSSHCTTPSDRPEDHTNSVAVKVGCFHVNPATPSGRRKFLLQMVVLCFVPHVALVVQNSTIMAQLSQTLGLAVYLNSEVETILSLGDLLLSLQRERMDAADYLLQESPKNMQFNKDLKKSNIYKRISIYKEINSVLLLYTDLKIKETSNVLWRQLLAANILLKTMEDLSLTLASFMYYSHSKDADVLEMFLIHKYSTVQDLVSASQYLEVEELAQSVRIIEDITKFHKQDYRMNLSTFYNIQYMNTSRHNLDRLRDVHTDLLLLIREMASSQVWIARRTLFIGVVILVVVVLASPVLVLLLRHVVYTIQTFTHSIDLSTQRLIAEKQKSDMLLSRMLPLPVLQRLRAQRTVPAESFDAVTIFFSDIVGFTSICATSTPMEVINMLNILYRLFDEKIMQYNVYKVETIGDAYMVVSGLPQRNGNRHVSEIADMSLSLMRSLEGATVPHQPCSPLLVRAGVHTGACVAGVVGATMPRYCLFGDTINTASRMESTGEAMKIHISYNTKKALDEIGNYQVESRGLVDVAGKGLMETFWLVGKVGGLRAESPRCRLHDYDQNLLEVLIKQ